MNGQFFDLQRFATIDNSNSNTLLSGTSGDDSIENYGDMVSIDSGEGDDTVTNYAANVSVDGGDGNDYIYSSNDSYSGAYVTINAGDGNDTVVGRFGDSSITGGAGDDVVSMTGDVDRATISGGTGNDTVYMDNHDGGNLYEYRAGDGNDVIYSFMENDMLSISGDTYSTEKSGIDLLVKVGDNTLTVKNAYDAINSININDEVISLKNAGGDLTDDNDEIVINRSSIAVNALDGDDSIYSYGNNVTRRRRRQ